MSFNIIAARLQKNHNSETILTYYILTSGKQFVMNFATWQKEVIENNTIAQLL